MRFSPSFVITACAVFVFSRPLLSNLGPVEGESATTPQAVVESFVKLDTAGSRLQQDGWKSADALFERRTPKKLALQVNVIAAHFNVSNFEGDSHDGHCFFGYELIGKLDDQLRFTAIRSSRETRSLNTLNVIALAKDGSTGATEWKIVGSQPNQTFLVPAAAIRYVTEMSDRSTRSEIKQNAKKSLEALKLYLR